MKRNLLLPAVAAFAMIGLVALGYVHRANISVFNPVGIIGREEEAVIIITLLLSSIVVLPVFCFLFWFAWRYRATGSKTENRHREGWDHDNWIAEAVWWVIPTIIVLLLSITAWKTSHDLDPYKPLKSMVIPITIQVVSLDWKWLFIYPDQGIASVNMVEFPTNTPVHFLLTSDAPMNSFWIPKLAGQIMVMPGMRTELNIMADTTGSYTGSSANISGRGFAGMTFVAKTVSQEDFEAWVMSVKGNSPPLTQDTYTALALPSERIPIMTYSLVAPDLFNAIIMKYMPIPHMTM